MFLVSDSFFIDIPQDVLTNFPHLKSLCKQLSLKYVHREVKESDLKTVGAQLWNALDIAESFETARQEAALKIMPVILRSDDPEILSLPWECLFHPDYGFIGKHEGFTLSRQIPGRISKQDPPPPGPLKVLLFR